VELETHIKKNGEWRLFSTWSFNHLKEHLLHKVKLLKYGDFYKIKLLSTNDLDLYIDNNLSDLNEYRIDVCIRFNNIDDICYKKAIGDKPTMEVNLSLQ
jgi:hypothetical protein